MMRELIKIQANKDSIYLDNIGRAKKEKQNRGIIDEESAMILNYLREHAKTYPMESDYLETPSLMARLGNIKNKCKKRGLKLFLKLNLCNLDSDNKPKKVKEVIFFDEELRNTDIAFFDSIYYFAIDKDQLISHHLDIPYSILYTKHMYNATDSKINH